MQDKQTIKRQALRHTRKEIQSLVPWMQLIPGLNKAGWTHASKKITARIHEVQCRREEVLTW